MIGLKQDTIIFYLCVKDIRSKAIAISLMKASQREKVSLVTRTKAHFLMGKCASNFLDYFMLSGMEVTLDQFII